MQSHSFKNGKTLGHFFEPLYIIFLLKAGHSAHKMVKYTHSSTTSTSNVHNRYLLHHLKSSRGYSFMLSSYDI